MILDLFDQAFFINLDHRHDRLAHIHSELDRIGLRDSVERFSGITVEHRGRFYKRGSRGNWLSHVAIWKEALRRGGGNLLIIEDDATFAPDFRKHFKRRVADLPDDWDFLYVHGWDWDSHGDGDRELDYPDGLHKIPRTMLTHFYGISATALPRLVENSDRNQRLAIDAWLMEHVHPTSQVYCCFPPLAWQDGSDSELSYELYEGAFRVEHETRVVGWARNMDKPGQSLTVEVMVGDEIMGRALANEYRQDLADAGMKLGKFGFRLSLPQRIQADELASVRVRVAGTDHFLSPGSR